MSLKMSFVNTEASLYNLKFISRVQDFFKNKFKRDFLVDQDWWKQVSGIRTLVLFLFFVYGVQVSDEARALLKVAVWELPSQSASPDIRNHHFAFRC